MGRILVVEDDSFLLQSLGWVIEDLGHSSLLATDLAGALRHLADPRQIDALFVDIRLHGSAAGGYDVANQAIGLRPALPVLYTSGSPLSDEMMAQFVLGGRFMQKPYSPAQVEYFVGELVH